MKQFKMKKQRSTNKHFFIVRVAEAQHLLQNHMPIENILMLKVMLHHAQSTVNQIHQQRAMRDVFQHIQRTAQSTQKPLHLRG